MFKDNLRKYRKLKGYSQAQLSNRVGVTRQAVSQWETGESVPSIDKMQLIADVLGIAMPMLVASPTAPPQPSASGVRIDTSAQMIDVPVLSREMVACCGDGIGLMDLTNPAEPGIRIPRNRLHRYDVMRPPYAIYADGDCLESAGVDSGDQIVINPAEEPTQGSVVLVSLYGMLSLKIIYRLGGGIVCLRSDYGDQRLSPADQETASFSVLGVLVATVKPRPRPRPF